MVRGLSQLTGSVKRTHPRTGPTTAAATTGSLPASHPATSMVGMSLRVRSASVRFRSPAGTTYGMRCRPFTLLPQTSTWHFVAHGFCPEAELKTSSFRRRDHPEPTSGPGGETCISCRNRNGERAAARNNENSGTCWPCCADAASAAQLAFPSDYCPLLCV